MGKVFSHHAVAFVDVLCFIFMQDFFFVTEPLWASRYFVFVICQFYFHLRTANMQGIDSSE